VRQGAWETRRWEERFVVIKVVALWRCVMAQWRYIEIVLG